MLILALGQEANRDIFSVFFNMKVCCVFSLESPHPGDSNAYTQYTSFIMKKKITLNYPISAMVFFPRDSRMSSKQPSLTSHQCLSHRRSPIIMFVI